MSETRNESVDERRGTNRREVTDKRNDAENERRNADRRAMERQPVVESAQPQANRTDAEQCACRQERTDPDPQRDGHKTEGKIVIQPGDPSLCRS